MGKNLSTFRNALANCMDCLANCIVALGNGLLRLANGLRINQPTVGEAKAANVNEAIDGVNASFHRQHSPPPSYLNDRVIEICNSTSEDLNSSELLSEVRRRFQDQIQGFTNDEIMAAIDNVRGNQDQERVGEDAAISSSGDSVQCLANPFR